MRRNRTRRFLLIALVALGANCGGGREPLYATLWIENSATYGDEDAPQWNSATICGGTEPHTLTLLSVSYCRAHYLDPGCPGPGLSLDIPPLAPGERVLVGDYPLTDPKDDKPYMFSFTWSDGTSGGWVCSDGHFDALRETYFTKSGDFVVKLIPRSP